MPGSDERIDKLEKSVRAMRELVREQDHGQRADVTGLRWAVLAALVAGSMLALTSATWRTTVYREDIVEVNSLWGLAPRGALASVTVALLLVIAVGSVGVFLSGIAGPRSHAVLAVLASLAVVPILFVGDVKNETPFSEAVDESGAGRWLTLVAALVLAVLHASRGAQLRRS
jgi:hypothetical protein